MSNKPNIVIDIGSYFVGLWLSVSKLLSAEYNVVITTGTFNKRLIKNNFPNISLSVENRGELYKKIVQEELSHIDLVLKAREFEEKYNETLAMVMSQNRALGKGYIFNADRHPCQKREYWCYELKIREILKEFIYWEYIVKKYSPVLFLAPSPNKILSLIAKKKGITFLWLSAISFADRWFWAENEYDQNSAYTKSVQEYVKSISITNVTETPIEFIHDDLSLAWNQISYGHYHSIKELVSRFPGDLYRFLTGYYTKNQGYRFLGWYPVVLRRTSIYKYFKKYGKKPDEVRNYKWVFFALHLEPELSLLYRSPEQNNSMEIISWISKSLPADTILVVKEQPKAYGIRSLRYYDNFRKINNVILASPEIHSWRWIKEARIIATITGTVGIEAVYFGKPVLSFGKHQIINHLPSVHYVNTFESVKDAVKELLTLAPDDIIFKKSKAAFSQAQKESSFKMTGLEKLSKSRKLHMELAKEAVKNLKEQYNL
jgi:hypothetical protein